MSSIWRMDPYGNPHIKYAAVRPLKTASGAANAESATSELPAEAERGNCNGQAAPSHDVFEHEPQFSEQPDWKSMAQELLDSLKQKYPGVDMVILENYSKDLLAGTAAGLGKGTHLIVTQDFLDRMGGSKEGYYKCKEVLTQLMGQLSSGQTESEGRGAVLEGDRITFWSASPSQKKEEPAGGHGFNTVQAMLERMKEGIEKSKNSRRMSSRHSSYLASASYGRLAGASTKAQVKYVMSEAHRTMGSLRLAVSLGDDKERSKARSAIAAQQKLLVRGSRKLRKLDEETLLKMRRKRAEQNDLRKKAAYLKQELERKRASRGSADSSIRAEGQLHDLNDALRFKNRHKSEREEMLDQIATTSPSVDTGIASPGISMDMGGFTAADVVVSETISF